MIVTIHRDGKHVADLKIDDMIDWADVCNAIRERMFPDEKLPKRDMEYERAMKLLLPEPKAQGKFDRSPSVRRSASKRRA